MLGIIFSEKKLKKFAAGKRTFYDHLDFYASLAKEHEVDLCFYSLKRIKPQTQTVKGYVLSYKRQNLSKKRVPVPQVNLFRNNTYLRKKRTIDMLRDLSAESGIIFINMVTTKERNKYKNYHYLNQVEEVQEHIPVTTKLSYANLARFLEKYEQVFIKPIRGSLGKNITTIKKRSQGYRIHHTERKRTFKEKIPAEELDDFYKDTFPKPKQYLLQPCLSLKKYKGKKFDIRVSVQKNKQEKWQVTGMVMRLAQPKGMVTNLAQGGRPVAFADIFPMGRKMKKQIRTLSLNIASALAHLYPSVADIGLDIAIDEDDQLWFLEANFCALKKSYKRLKDRKTRRAVYRTPFEYAYTVYMKEKEGNRRDRNPF